MLDAVLSVTAPVTNLLGHRGEACSSRPHHEPVSGWHGASRSIFVVALLVILICSTQNLVPDSIGKSPHISQTAPLSSSHPGVGLTKFRPPHLPARPLGTGVNPYLFHSAEPAPLGISDYGVDGADNPYVYSTAAFAGQIQIDSISSYNSSLPNSHQIGFQLNVNLYLAGGTTVYAYWVQDVAILNVSTGRVLFLDNVWNSSSPGAGLTTESLVGNGTIAPSGSTTFYYDFAASTLPGEFASLSLPTNVTMEVVAADTSGVPTVAFEYNDGFGWVTYDNVRFPSSAGFRDFGFLVDGYGYKPDGAYYDAELILGGPGGGSQTTISSTHVELSLYFWNGYNFQEVVNTYNFGSDTAEGLNNGLSAGFYYLKNGSLFAKVTDVAGTLGSLYDHTFVGTVNISTPVGAGELYINGTDYGPFYGYEANVTVGPGTYLFSIYIHGVFVASKTAAIGRGQYVPLRIGFGALFAVTFVESGLPSETTWTVTVGNTTLNSTAGSISFAEPNGTFSYSVGAVPGYTVTPQTGSVMVSGSSVTKDLAWSEERFVITFLETGLPAGTSWSVTLQGSTVSSSTASINFTEAAGSYPYALAGVAGFRTNLWQGTVVVTNSNQTVRVGWTQVTYPAWFNETGLPVGFSWEVDLQVANGYLNGSYTNPSASVQLPNGTYPFTVNGPTTYVASPASGTLTLTGGPRAQSVTFSIRDGWIVGTLSPSSAALWLGSILTATSGGTFNESEGPATISVEVTASGYEPYFSNVTVSPARVTWLNVTLNALPTSSAGQILGIPTYELVGIGVVAVAVGAIAAMLVMRRRKPNSPQARPPAGAR